MATVESKLDMSLDDLAKSAPKSSRGRGRGRGAGRRGGRGGGGDRRGRQQNGRRGNNRRSNNGEGFVNPLSRDYDMSPQDAFASGPVRNQRRGRQQGPYDRPAFDDDAAWTHDKFESAPVVRKKGRGNVVKVEGLSNEITPRDLQEIFEEAGTVEDISINSMGQAHVIFRTAAEAKSAVEEFDQAEVDGVPMSLSVADSAPSVARRVVTPASLTAPRHTNLYSDQGYAQQYQYSARRGARGAFSGRAPTRSSRGRPQSGRGRNNNSSGRGRGRGRQPRTNTKREAKPTVSATDLDAEMDDYFKTKA